MEIIREIFVMLIFGMAALNVWCATNNLNWAAAVFCFGIGISVSSLKK